MTTDELAGRCSPLAGAVLDAADQAEEPVEDGERIRRAAGDVEIHRDNGGSAVVDRLVPNVGSA